MISKAVEEAFRGTFQLIGILFWIAFAGVIAILGWIGYGLYLWLN